MGRWPAAPRLYAAAAAALQLCCVGCCSGASDVYTDLWAVQVDGGEAAAKLVAERHGFVYVGRIMPGFYHFRHSKVQKRSTDAEQEYTDGLANESLVRWFEQQVVKRRVKRDKHFNDPKWPHMWYLRGLPGASAMLDMNVRKAWARGYSGRGVVVTILDDGIEKSHPDLEKNYDPEASYDVNDSDNDPSPRYDNTNENRHGTRCAGEVAAVANNGICSVGVAHEASIGGIRMLDGDVTDSVEANALSYNSQHIDIYSISWGPEDDGKTVDGPGSLARRAFREGVAKGRKGKGSIYVWASGNGGRDMDNCNCDGYTNSIYTLSISSVTENGYVPWYSEACSSTLATTFSSGGPGERQIMTTDLRRNCTDTHTGTSASAPLAAGICALALQANPSLTWRDMQHLVVMTANPAGLHSLSEWRTNGVGRNVSHNFGYGMMDAAAMVALAENWTTVPEQHICEIESAKVNEMVPQTRKIVIPLMVDGCSSDLDRHVKYLEHVQAKVSLSSSRRGDISIYLRSPMGTLSTLLAQRPNDNDKEGFKNWAFMTTHMWGEKARGIWQLEVHNGYRAMKPARLHSWSLILHGTNRSIHSNSEAERAQLTRSVGRDAVGVGQVGVVGVGGSTSTRGKTAQWTLTRQSASAGRPAAAGLEDDDAQMIARSDRPAPLPASSWRSSSNDRGDSPAPLQTAGGYGRSDERRQSTSIGCSAAADGSGTAVRSFEHGDHRHELPCWPDGGSLSASGDGDEETRSDNTDTRPGEIMLGSSGVRASDAVSTVFAGDDETMDPSFSLSTPRPVQHTAKRQHAGGFSSDSDDWTLALRAAAAPDDLRAAQRGRAAAVMGRDSGARCVCGQLTLGLALAVAAAAAGGCFSSWLPHPALASPGG